MPSFRLNTFRLPTAALLSMGALISAQAQASGFALNEQSVSGLGSAYAGRAAIAEDATTVYGNPAGMTYLEGANLSGSMIYIHASSDITDLGSSNSGTTDGDMVPGTVIPSLFYTQQLDDKWSVGLGIYAPFGLATEYESSFVGRNHALDSDITTVNFQPTVAYKFNDQFSVGAGVYASYVEAKLTKALDYAPIANGESELKGDDWGWGYNIGAIWQITDATRLGATYHSKTDYTLEGDVTISGTFAALPNIPQAGKTKAEADLTTPESFELALTHALDERWTLLASATYTRWSRFEKLLVEAAANGAEIENINESWHNTWFYSVGANYRLNDQWLLRAGYAIDESPIGNKHRTARVPTGDRQWFTVGANYAIDENLDIDLGLAYLVEEKVEVHETNRFNDSYNAKYDNAVLAAGLQLNYQF